MDKILSLLTEIKGYFTGINTALANLTAAEARVASLQTELATATAASAASAVQVTDLTFQLNSARTEVIDLTASVDAEKKRANETLAAQGLPPGQLPAIVVTVSPGSTSETAWKKYQRLSSTDPRAAGAFWASSADQILQSRN